MRILTHDDYTVGWICAVPMELAASMTMLDEEDSSLPSHPFDYNTYTLGRVGQHNVAMACLPAGHFGTNSAATVATQMKFTFKSIRFGLMVGVGGGVPSQKKDIRLGDVVVSKPTSQNGGIVQYDFGKTISGEFKRTGALNSPPEILLAAVSKLEAKHFLNQNSVARYLSEIPPNTASKFTYLGPEHDRLFEASYEHVGTATCDSCDVTRLVKRVPAFQQALSFTMEQLHQETRR